MKITIIRSDGSVEALLSIHFLLPVTEEKPSDEFSMHLKLPRRRWFIELRLPLFSQEREM
ncbi:Bgt-20455 [Blumeria graminis f. sp. tritici]|uniref:Bgt-20455 n=2 Tax=Blumeria graminis f. sp. tritici TaxID=62690 RepID=A0A381LEV1_BLUGR|nr:Bgt-20455 [Blumeria graminis f. sp. tritici]